RSRDRPVAGSHRPSGRVRSACGGRARPAALARRGGRPSLRDGTRARGSDSHARGARRSCDRRRRGVRDRARGAPRRRPRRGGADAGGVAADGRQPLLGARAHARRPEPGARAAPARGGGRALQADGGACRRALRTRDTRAHALQRRRARDRRLRVGRRRAARRVRTRTARPCPRRRDAPPAAGRASHRVRARGGGHPARRHRGQRSRLDDGARRGRPRRHGRRPDRAERRHGEQDRHLFSRRARPASRHPALRGRADLDRRPADGKRRRHPDRGARRRRDHLALRRPEPGLRRHAGRPDRRDRHRARRAPRALRRVARPMKALVLAAGYATRLYPLTEPVAKPLLPLAGRPMLDYLLERIRTAPEIDEIHLVTNHKFADAFTEWAASRNVVVHDDGTTSEDDRLGAIGDIQFVVDRIGLDDDLFVVAGDNLFDYSVGDYVRFWRGKGDGSAIVLYDVGDLELVRKYSSVEVDANDRVTRLVEKPESPESTLVGTASYIYAREHVPLVRRYLDEGNAPDQPGRFLVWLVPRAP